jgi:ABC-type transport system substrate-binding protein
VSSLDKWEAYFQSYPSYAADPDAYLYRWFHSKGIRRNLGLKDPVTDVLIDLGRQLMNPPSRQIVYRRLQEHLAQLAPAIYTWRMDMYYGVQSYVKGVKVNPKYVYLEGCWLDSYFSGIIIYVRLLFMSN